MYSTQSRNEVDPLESGLLPADPYWLEVNTDVPSGPGVRPFGLSYLSSIPDENVIVLVGLKYDPFNQITVDADGVPVIYSFGRKQATHCAQTTMEDGQTWTDNTADDWAE